jgi:hypothetical protein
MSIIQVNQIEAHCRAKFTSLIDMSDIKAGNAEEKEVHFLSRALAAFAISALARIDDLPAAQSVVDESKDDGIDAFFFDRNEHIVYLVQSKWVKNGTASVDVGSVHKFKQGVNDFLAGKTSALGPKLQAKAADILEATSDTQASFVLVIAYTGQPSLSADVMTVINPYLNELNDDGAMASLRVLKQKDLHDIVRTGAMGSPIKLTIMLHEFGRIDAPYTAYYGQVVVSDIVPWGQHGDRLYHQNIRSFKGNTDVNDAIVKTMRENPENFLYFNNGITILCSELEKQPLGGVTKSSGVFECKGSSIINGAQTVGSIISAFSASETENSNARVMVKLISLKNCPPDFAGKVTKATNTQNKIEKRDFAALDPTQFRLKTELRLSLNKEYVFRTGEQPPAPDKGCTLDEATVALACANPDITYCMEAKRAISRLYEDIEKPPYTVLFNAGVTPTKLWRSVEVLRNVDEFLKKEQQEREAKEKLIAIHGNRVLLHLVFKALGAKVFDDDKAQAEMARIPEISLDRLNKITKEVLTNHSASYPGNIFKNTAKCTAIVAEVEKAERTGLEPASA